MIPIWFILFYICVGIFSKKEDKGKSIVVDGEQFLGNAQKGFLVLEGLRISLETLRWFLDKETLFRKIS